MRIPAHANRSAEEGELKMTSMIDVVFLLLIFFVCTASFERLEAELPTQLQPTSGTEPQPIDAPEEADPRQVVVSVSLPEETVLWHVGEQACSTPTELRAALREIAESSTTSPVLLVCAGDVPYGELIRLYDICRELQFAEIGFAVTAGQIT